MKKQSNLIVKIDKVLHLDFKKEAILADLENREAIEEAFRDFVEKKKSERG